MGIRRLKSGRVSLQQQLVFFIVLILVPFLAYAGVGIRNRYRHEVRQEIEQNKEFAHAVRAVFMGFLEDLWDIELALGNAIALNNLNVEQTETYLRQQFGQGETSSIFIGIHWVNPEGIFAASTLPDGRGLSIVGREYYERVLAGENKVVSNILIGRYANRPLIMVGRAIRHDGNLRGLVLVSVQMEEIHRRFPMKTPNNGNFGLIDANGVYAYGEFHPIPPPSPSLHLRLRLGKMPI